MADTSRRSVLTGAAGLAAGSALPLPPMPALAQAEPFRIEPSANYVEYRRLGKLMADSERDAIPGSAGGTRKAGTSRGSGCRHC